MEAKKKRNIKSGVEYDNLFPRSENDNKTIRRNANVYHTVDFIPKVVKETLEQTKSISKILKGTTTYETCSNIWHFIYGHINYKKDNDGYEQIRSPARTWHDRIQGVDCDCYTVFISSILMNLGIPHILRITKYHRDYFQHIYPIVPHNGKYITIDCVTDNFNYEVPFSEKKDYPMDLQYLNGFDGDGMDELGKIIKRNMASKKPTTPTAKKANPSQRPNPKPVKKAGGLLKKIKSKATSKPTAAASSQPSVPAVKQKKKGLLKKVVSAVNKVNPATVLLRNGILAAMKLNVKNVAARLRWSYLTPEQASSKGIEPAKFQKLVGTRQKLEKIFDTAGGKTANLKKAILSGKGNKDKAVSGLGMLPMVEWSGYMSEYTPLDQLLGPEIYYSENVEGMESFSGFGELGEPVTLATVGAAMGVIAGIVAALKQIGDIFKSKQKGSEDFDDSKTEAPENNVDVPKTDSSSSVKVPAVSTNNIIPDSGSTENFVSNSSENNINESQDAPIRTSNDLPATYNSNEIVPQAESEDKLSPTTTDNNANSNADADKESFWDKNKKWLKPVAIGVGGLTLIAIGFKMLKGKEQNKSSPKSHSLSGLPRKKKKKYKKNKQKQKHKQKHAIALL
jgi:hypothetical protein